MQISRLRKALAGEDGSGGAGLIVTRERGYRLAIAPEQLDAYRFERLVAEGRQRAGRRPSRVGRDGPGARRSRYGAARR